MNIFFNSGHDLRSGWKFAIFTVVFVAAWYAAGLFLVMVYLRTTIPESDLTEFVLNNIARFAAAVVATLFVAGFVDRVPLAVYGVTFHERWKRDLLMGLGISAAMLVLFL